jgi:hypothetical protein
MFKKKGYPSLQHPTTVWKHNALPLHVMPKNCGAITYHNISSGFFNLVEKISSMPSKLIPISSMPSDFIASLQCHQI